MRADELFAILALLVDDELMVKAETKLEPPVGRNSKLRVCPRRRGKQHLVT